MEVYEGPEFMAGLINKGFESINMDVGANGRVDLGIEFEVNRVVRLLIRSMEFC
jgi:hypothetical protein